MTSCSTTREKDTSTICSKNLLDWILQKIARRSVARVVATDLTTSTNFLQALRHWHCNHLFGAPSVKLLLGYSWNGPSPPRCAFTQSEELAHPESVGGPSLQSFLQNRTRHRNDLFQISRHWPCNKRCYTLLGNRNMHTRIQTHRPHGSFQKHHNTTCHKLLDHLRNGNAQILSKVCTSLSTITCERDSTRCPRAPRALRRSGETALDRQPSGRTAFAWAKSIHVDAGRTWAQGSGTGSGSARGGGLSVIRHREAQGRPQHLSAVGDHILKRRQ